MADEDLKELMRVCLKGVEDQVEALAKQTDLIMDFSQKTLEVYSAGVEKRLNFIEATIIDLRTFKDEVTGKADQSEVHKIDSRSTLALFFGGLSLLVAAGVGIVSLLQ